MFMKITQKSEHHNLMLNDPTTISGDLCVIVGKNGAGKSRFLEAINGALINVEMDGIQLNQQDIAYFNMQNIKPALQMGFDRVKYQEEIKAAAHVYEQHRDAFMRDHQGAISQIRDRGRTEHLNALALYNTVKTASIKTGVDANSLTKEDIAKFYSNSAANALGQQNVTATFLQYVERLAQNEANNALNIVYERNLPCYSEAEFLELYGPAPWEIFNEILSDVLGGVYYVPVPKVHSNERYEAKLIRTVDHKEVNHSHLSSGEQVLLWLVISIYNSSIYAFEHHKPKLILLDEPDAFLHPQMVEKLYLTFEHVVSKFGCKIIFTTHSPTTIALFRGEEIYQITEDSLDRVEKDLAISELLDGVTQVSISYSNRRQVYVESHYDAQLYEELFEFLRVRRIGISGHITLSFIPAGSKISSEEVRQKALAVFGPDVEQNVDDFVTQIQGIGSCSRVYGTVESLCREGCKTVYGIVDWDLANKSRENVFVLSDQIFYSIENAILNPLCLGFYLLQNYRRNVSCHDFGVDEALQFSEHYKNIGVWQSIADFVAKKVLGKDTLDNAIPCKFANGFTVYFDADYVHMKGHDLEARIKSTFHYLNEHNKSEAALKIDVMRKEMFAFSEGKTIPSGFINCFESIQA